MAKIGGRPAPKVQDNIEHVALQMQNATAVNRISLGELRAALEWAEAAGLIAITGRAS
jgi:hypothetical protein